MMILHPYVVDNHMINIPLGEKIIKRVDGKGSTIETLKVPKSDKRKQMILQAIYGKEPLKSWNPVAYELIKREVSKLRELGFYTVNQMMEYGRF